MPNRRRHLILVVLLSLGMMSACGDSIVLPDDADEELIQGFEVFNTRCAQCHGRDGKGGIGLSLAEIEDRLTDEEQRSVVVEGRKRMPSFRNTLSEDDIEAVVRFTREIL